jgi:hypothetical protein
VNAPSLFVVGGVIVKAAFPSALDKAGKLVRTVVIGFTVKVAVIVPDKYFSVLACSAVIVEVPDPIIVTTSPSMVATSVFELVYVNAPVLFVVGGTNEKLVSPTVFVIAEKLLRTVIIGLT